MSGERSAGLIAGVVVAAMLVALAAECVPRMRGREREWVGAATGVNLPAGETDFFLVHDSLRRGHKWASGHVALPRSCLQDFIRQNHFAVSDAPDLSFVFSLQKMPDNCQRVLHDDAVYGLSGYTRDDELPFVFLLDAKSGDLWFNIQYAE